MDLYNRNNTPVFYWAKDLTLNRYRNRPFAQLCNGLRKHVTLGIAQFFFVLEDAEVNVSPSWPTVALLVSALASLCDSRLC